MTWRKEHTIISVIKITEVLGFSLILPFLPFYAQDLGASPFQVGLILMTFSLFQFFSSPIMGKLSDSYGRRPLLILSQLSTLVSFIVLGLAHNLWWLVISRAIDGLLGSNYTIAQAYLSDITPKKERTQIFSISGMAFSIGFFIGPGIGGYLSQFNYSLPSFLAAGMAGITILATYFYLPETISQHKKKKFNWSGEIFKLDQFKYLFSKNKLKLPLWGFFSYVLTHGLWVSSFALYAQRQINFQSKDIGYLFTLIGAVTLLIRGVIMPMLLKIFTENNLKLFGAIFIILSLGLTPLVATQWHLIVLTLLFGLGGSILRPTLISYISQSATDEKQGEFMGLTQSLGSVSQIIGPLIGGFLINNFFPGSLGLVAAGVMLVGFLVLLLDRLS